MTTNPLLADEKDVDSASVHYCGGPAVRNRVILEPRDLDRARINICPKDQKKVRGHGYTRPMRLELRNDDAGRYLVTTARGSQDELDLTGRTVKRQMAAISPIVDFLDACFSQLRRDGETVELLMLESCVVGASARCWLQTRADHVPTLRMTSPVMRIEHMAKPEA